METVISNAGNDSSPPGNGKLMHTINFFPPGELAYARLILCCRYFDLQPICNSICHVPTICQLVHYTRLVAGGRCFYVFQLYSRQKTLIHFCTRMNKIHLCFLRVLCGEQMHNRKTITLYAASHTPMADNRHTS